MKPLSIEELKDLKVGDWVWLDDGICEGYRKITLTSAHGMCLGASDSLNTFRYLDYSKTWLAYKNKEQAETKGEIVDIEDAFCCAMVGTTEQGEKYVSLEDYKHDIHKLWKYYKRVS